MMNILFIFLHLKFLSNNMLVKWARNLGLDGTITRTLIIIIKSMAHVCSNTFFSIFLRRDTLVLGKMTLLH